MGKEEIGLPSGGTYLCSVLFSIIPKVVVIVFAVIIAAYRAELFSALLSGDTRELPVGVCVFTETDDDVYGDRICNNGIACAISSILVAMMLMIVDLQIPCTNSTFARLAHLLTLLWAVGFALYWLITSALLADLYERFCDAREDAGRECGENQEKFIVIPVFGFVCMGAWIGQAVMSLIRLIIGK